MKHQFLTGAAMALVAALPAAPAFAQNAGEGAEAAEEIIVTARRQNERLQEVPASVSVLTAAALEQTGSVKTEDFVRLTPGVTIVTGTAEAGDTQINIRGINGARDAESSVALVVDGILKTNTAQLNQPQGTLRQVEVLKGPQGAIYGRNAAAGAIVIQTLKPGDRLEGGITGSYANENTVELRGHVAGPLADGAGFVVSGYYRTTDGFYRNRFLGTKTVDDQKNWALDGRLLFDKGEGTSFDFKARYAQFKGASLPFNAAFHLPNFGGAFYEDVDAHQFRFYNNIRASNDQDSLDVSLKMDHEFDGMKLSAWVLYSNVQQDLTADGTSADFARYITNANPAVNSAVASCFSSTAALTGFPVNPPGGIGTLPVPFIFDPVNGSTFGPYSPSTCDGTQYQVRNQKDLSAEVRLSSDTDGPLSWQVGAYFLSIDRKTGVSLGADTGAGVIKKLYNAPGSANPTSLLLADKFDTSVYAGFGSVEWRPSDQISAGLALRYDREERDSESLVPTAFDPFTGGPINPGQAFGALQPQSAAFSQVQPKITFSYRPNPDLNIYANWGIGFKSGGFNNQGSAALINANFNQFINAGVTIFDRYDKETSSAFEAGVKGSLLNGRLTFDLAGYHTRIDDMQFFEFFVGSFGLLRVVSNIDKVDVTGAELNVTARILDGWKVFGSANVTDSKIKKNTSRPYTVGNKSPYTADYTLNFGTEVEADLTDSVRFIARADYRITGPTWFHTVQNQERPTLFSGLLPIPADPVTSPNKLVLPGFVGNAKYDVSKRNTFGVLNLRAGIEYGDFRIAAFANNATDKKYIAEAIPAIEFGGSFISPGARRLIGVEAGYKF